MTLEQYQNLIFSTVDYIATNLIAPIEGDSQIATRYITSEGQNDEDWIGYLRNDSGIVDIWLITIVGFRGLPGEQKAVGTFDKPITILIDYFADYRQGLNFDDTDLDDIKTNTERKFLKKVIALDFALENLTDCLPNGTLIESWETRMSLKKFTSDTTHRSTTVLNLKMTGIKKS